MDKAGTTPGATGKLTQSKISDFVEQLDSGSKKKNKLREVSPIPEDDMTPSRRLRAAGKEVDSASEKDTKKSKRGRKRKQSSSKEDSEAPPSKKKNLEQSEIVGGNSSAGDKTPLKNPCPSPLTKSPAG